MRAISAIAIAFVLYYGVLAVIPGQTHFFLRHLIVLSLTIIFIAGIRAVRQEEMPIRKSLEIFLFALFLYNISEHYLVSEPKTSKQQTHYFPKDSIFGPGSHYICVDGETPFVIHIRNNRMGYSISLQNGQGYGREVKFLFDDGEVFTYRRGVGGMIPYKKDPRFVLRGEKACLILQVF